MHALILITTPNREEAESLSRHLLEARLAACVNLLPVSSRYWWKDKIEEAEEVLMIVKTRSSLIQKLTREVRLHHSYEVPEVLSLEITQGDTQYLKWIDKSLVSGRRKSG